MAGMQRFVTYLYSYKGNEKRNNTGFAKVEIRGGQCRLEIHLKGALSREPSPAIYLYSRDGETMHAVKIGSLTAGSGGADFKSVIQSEGIAGSPYGIYDINGIWIPVDDEYMFASQWDDGEIIRERMRIWEPQQTDAEGQQRVVEEPQVAEQLGAREESDVVEKSEPTGESQRVEASEPEEALNLTEGAQAEEPQAVDQQGHTRANRATTVQATEIPLRKQLQDGEAEILLDCYLRLQSKKQRAEILETGKRQTSGMQIELRDLRELPKQYWNLGNNSFLLHGFFTYQYLLLGKRTEGESERIFIGVPGVFHGQEQIMASLFGFAEFVPGYSDGNQQNFGELREIDTPEQFVQNLRAAELAKDGQPPFGYWCHFL